MAGDLRVEYGTKTILDLRSLQQQGHLNLEPGFQRKSVWTIADRRKFVQSILEGFPVPSIFLYRRTDDGLPIYDVLDGKQRLETIFMFSGVRPFKKYRFEVKHEFTDDGDWDWWNWKGLEHYKRTAPFLEYKIQVAEVSGDFADIVELFVRINSTGKALTSSERRHARYYTSPFLKQAEKLAKRYREYLKQQQIVLSTGVERMKDVELVSELLASIQAGGPIHKKQAVDKAIGGLSVNAHTLAKIVREFTGTLQTLKRMFPDLRTTRFKNQSEFYSLFLVVWNLRQGHLILNDRNRNRVAMDLLRRFSDSVDEVRERQRKAKGAKPSQRLFADYLLLVQQSTDALFQRTRRGEVVAGLFAGLFERKDDRRTFSSEQRRMLWNSEDKKKCRKCGDALDWTDFQIDHLTPHSKGGRTELRNAALMCGPCNREKGTKMVALSALTASTR